MKTFYVALTPFIAAVAMTLSGCGDTPETKPTTPPPAANGESGHGHEHAGHGVGPHEGTVADWGGGKYHVEFTVDHNKKQATVYILGGDEKSPAPISAKTVLLSIADPEIQAELAASPQAGDKEGTSSRFVGTHDNLGIVQEYQGSISGEVDGTPYVGEFKEEPHEHE